MLNIHTYTHIFRFNLDALVQINYLGPSVDRTQYLPTEATLAAASCPAFSIHATESVSNPNDIHEAALTSVWNAQVSISTPVRLFWTSPKLRRYTYLLAYFFPHAFVWWHIEVIHNVYVLSGSGYMVGELGLLYCHPVQRPCKVTTEVRGLSRQMVFHVGESKHHCVNG